MAPRPTTTTSQSRLTLRGPARRVSATSAAFGIETHRSVADRLRDVAADIEAHVLHRRIPAEPEPVRRHPRLHPFAYRPVLAVDKIPELDRIGRVERRPCQLVGVEQPVDDHQGPVRRLGDQDERGDMVGRQADHQVRIDQLALVADAFLLVQARERRSVGRPGHRERERALRLRHAGVPVQVRAAALLECGDDPAELRDARRRSDSTRCSSRR